MKNFNYTVTKYKGMVYPKTGEIIPLSEVLESIKEGDRNLSLIKTAREYGKGNIKYNYIKSNKLPTIRFNFLFNGTASNKNIHTSTGLIYLDVDSTDTIPDNNYVFAKWKSLSDTGYGILVKIKNLTQINYKNVYNKLSEIIGIKSDAGARKATQQTVLSYDSNLYYNPNSITYIYKEEEKVSSSIIKEEKEGIGSYDTFNQTNVSNTIRFNNINDYFKDDTPYIVFKEKVKICAPYTPNKIPEGKRNSSLFFLLSQYALLNPHQGYKFLYTIGQTIINKMHPKLSKQELIMTISKVISGRENKSLQLYLNQERRILFNPNIKFTQKETMQIVNRELGSLKKEKTRTLIYFALESWNFQSDGKLTQINIAKKANISIATMKRYSKEYRDYISFLKS